MLHEEVNIKWEDILTWVHDFQLLEKLRPELVVGVSIRKSYLDFVYYAVRRDWLTKLGKLRRSKARTGLPNGKANECNGRTELRRTTI